MTIQFNILTEVTNEDIIDGKFIVPEGLKMIGNCVFWGCTSLQSIVLPEGLKWIGSYAFRGCTSLTHVILPASLEEIGWGAFDVCTSLQSIILPETLREIGSYAFSSCINLNDVQGGNRELVNQVKLQALIGRIPPNEKMIEWSKLATKN